MKGEVWLYKDPRSNKIRPMVIVGEKHTGVELDISICKLTTHEDIRDEYDIVIEDWKKCGLAKPSVVRCSKITTVQKDELRGRVAKLTDAELNKVLVAVCKYIMA